jgi:UDP-2,3-diacylglucosamine hydrolase
MNTLFISDLHLDDRRPETTRLALDFLDGPAQTADAVYILGDLFEFWIGDDALSASAVELARSTATLNTAGVPCYFIHGNRDFLLGQAYAEQAGLQLLPEQVVVDLYGKPTLLLHGDTLCTDDVEYQAFRQQTRNPIWQQGVLALSVEERLKMALEARDASIQHTGSTSMDIMDVNAAAVLAAFRENGVGRMIHGHTHRPAFHRHALEAGNEAERIVLADWYRSGSYLEISAQGARSVEI